MLDILSDGFRQAKEKFQGKTTLTEDNVKEAVGLIRQSLLEADVEYGVAKDFLNTVQEKAVGLSVELKAGKGGAKKRVTASDHFIKICQDELEALMGPPDANLELPEKRPATIMMVGLQGSGKTTTTGKICRYLMDKQKKKPLLVAADIYRPAAVDQLKVLGERLGVPVYHQPDTSPVDICNGAVKHALDTGRDTILFDTAGRLTIDEALMQELVDIKSSTSPDNILLVCDSMMGQDAVTTAKSFNETLDISGVVMTKLDGDARGGAALSIRRVTGKPIKFLGMGEELDRLEEFRPEGLASRILGMGDIVGLMHDFERVADEDKEEDAMRMLAGKFNFKDFYEQLSMIQKMGSLKDIMAKLPMGGLPKDVNVDDKELVKIKSMIDSMTEKERLKPSLIDESRANRIAGGSGRKLGEVADLLKRFKMMRDMMGNMGKNLGMLGKIPGMGALKNMGQMRQMAQSMMGGGGDMAAAMQGMGGLMGGGMGAGAPKKPADKNRLRKQRKAKRQARKKNRKK